MNRASRDCDSCVGTGWQLLMRSWFIQDGYRRERCGICGGTGKSSYRDEACRKWQITARHRGGLPTRAAHSN